MTPVQKQTVTMHELTQLQGRSQGHHSCQPRTFQDLIVLYFGAVLCCFSSISFSLRSVLVSWWGLREDFGANYFLGIKMTDKRF